MNLLRMPKLSPTMEEGVIAQWHKEVGDKVESGDLLLEITTDKATVEHNALDGGYLRAILAKEGEVAKMNEPIAILTDSADEAFELPKKEEEKPKEEIREDHEQEAAQVEVAISGPKHVPSPPLKGQRLAKKPAEARVKASPLAKKLAGERGLDLSTVRGSGTGGRIVSKDLEKAQPKGIVTFGSSALPQEAPGEYEEVALSPMRRVIAKRLQESKMFIPHFYVTKKIRAGALIALREQLKELGLKVSFNDLVVRGVALALREHPQLNAGFNSVEEKLIHFKTIDISIAVALEEGLITPIIRYADYKDLGEISAETKELVKRAAEGKLSEEEYRGGSFTVSNLGMYGVDEFVAVINPPQAAILAVGGIIDEAVVENGQLAAGKSLSLTLSVDHRVVDGAEAALFLKSVQHLLEHPASLLLS